jgi:NADPH:quinone reductase-like Zn-dependent oxidoreductase
VIGFTDNRASQAELVVVEAGNVTARPPGVPWPVAGALFVAGTTAYATVRAVSASSGDTVVVAGAAGGVGSITVQLAILAGATVIGLASEPNHAWLKGLGVIPVSYGDGVEQRIDDATGSSVDAMIDLAGGYVQVALDLGIKPERVDTVVDFGAGEKYGVKTEGTAAAANAGVLAELATQIDKGKVDVPIARVYPLEQVREAFRELEQGHTRGKIVLAP